MPSTHTKPFRINPIRINPIRISPTQAALTLLLAPVLLAGCSRPQPTAEQVAGPSTPQTALRLGPTPPGGPSEAPTGSGAGGSAAGGAQFGRIGSTIEGPTVPDQPAGITYSRMSPVGSSGSGNGDRGNPVPPDVSLAAPPDPVAPRVLAPAKQAPILRATQQRLLGHGQPASVKGKAATE